MAIPARATLLSRGGMFGVPAPGADRLLALPVRHGDAEPVRSARRLHAEASRLFARELHHAAGRGDVAVIVPAVAQRAENHRVVRRRGAVGEGRANGDGLRSWGGNDHQLTSCGRGSGSEAFWHILGTK